MKLRGLSESLVSLINTATDFIKVGQTVMVGHYERDKNRWAQDDQDICTAHNKIRELERKLENEKEKREELEEKNSKLRKSIEE